jgi:16S rRNA (cytosine967-C5)-methyltransferase
VFGILRRRIGFEFHTGAATPRRLLLAYLNRVQGMSLRQLEPLIGKDDAQWAAGLKARPETDAPLYVKAEWPEWLTTMLLQDMAGDEILALGRALQQPAPLDLRVNALTADRDKVMQQLAIEGLKVQPTPYSPLGIRIDGNPALGRNALFTSGRIEIQDEGSQLLAYLVAPKRREMVIDFCAGAGGKTLALGALMQSQGRLYAFDVSESRLNKMKPRLARSGLSNVHPQLLVNENDIKVKRLAGKIDRVLVDAPCSGIGSARRRPELLWRVDKDRLSGLAARQLAIVGASADLVRPGGRLVYAVCTFPRAETDAVCDALLRARPDLSPVRTEGPDGPAERHRLWPHRHGSDGMFVAAFLRAS